MNRDDIIRMAQEAAIMPPDWGATENQWRSLEAFANLVAEAERLAYEAGRKDENEACAEACEEADIREFAMGDQPYPEWYAKLIRARREQ